VLRVGRYRFSFFSNQGTEPPHIHVNAAGDQAKFWLNLVELERNHGFNVRELNQMLGIITQHQQELLEAWNEYFAD